MKKMILSFSLILIISIFGLRVFKHEKVLNDELLINGLDNMVGVYIEDENGEYISSSDIPQKDGGYTFNHAVCENDIEVTWDEENWTLLGPSNATNWKCNLYFDKSATFLATKIKEYNKSTRTINSIYTDTTTKLVFTTEDESGTSYYFAGNPTDNWVYFAGFYWRIIRINGDGSIRLIYNGIDTSQTGETTQINILPFNNSYRDNAYVGYMYGATGANNYNDTHQNINDSTVKVELDSWYKENIMDKDFDKYISQEAGFCNDRALSTISRPYYGGLGYGLEKTAYISLDKISNSNNAALSVQTPTYTCNNENDLFTTDESNKGNHALTYPIGLITLDELLYAGAFSGQSNTDFYLYTNQRYWTMTPANCDGYLIGVFYFRDNGRLDGYGGNVEWGSMGIRPVINLKSDVQISSGIGTSTDPYIIN